MDLALWTQTQRNHGSSSPSAGRGRSCAAVCSLQWDGTSGTSWVLCVWFSYALQCASVSKVYASYFVEFTNEPNMWRFSWNRTHSAAGDLLYFWNECQTLLIFPCWVLASFPTLRLFLNLDWQSFKLILKHFEQKKPFTKHFDIISFL